MEATASFWKNKARKTQGSCKNQLFYSCVAPGSSQMDIVKNLLRGAYNMLDQQPMK